MYRPKWFKYITPNNIDIINFTDEHVGKQGVTFFYPSVSIPNDNQYNVKMMNTKSNNLCHKNNWKLALQIFRYFGRLPKSQIAKDLSVYDIFGEGQRTWVQCIKNFKISSIPFPEFPRVKILDSKCHKICFFTDIYKLLISLLKCKQDIYQTCPDIFKIWITELVPCPLVLPFIIQNIACSLGCPKNGLVDYVSESMVIVTCEVASWLQQYDIHVVEMKSTPTVLIRLAHWKVLPGFIIDCIQKETAQYDKLFQTTKFIDDYVEKVYRGGKWVDKLGHHLNIQQPIYFYTDLYNIINVGQTKLSQYRYLHDKLYEYAWKGTDVISLYDRDGQNEDVHLATYCVHSLNIPTSFLERSAIYCLYITMCGINYD